MKRNFEVLSVDLVCVHTKSNKRSRSRRGSWSFSSIVLETKGDQSVKRELQVGFSPQATEFHIEHCVNPQTVFQHQADQSNFEEWQAGNNILSLALAGENTLAKETYIKSEVLDKIKARIQRLLLHNEVWKADKKGRPFVRDAKYGTLTIHDMGPI